MVVVVDDTSKGEAGGGGGRVSAAGVREEDVKRSNGMRSGVYDMFTVWRRWLCNDLEDDDEVRFWYPYKATYKDDVGQPGSPHACPNVLLSSYCIN